MTEKEPASKDLEKELKIILKEIRDNGPFAIHRSGERGLRYYKIKKVKNLKS